MESNLAKSNAVKKQKRRAGLGASAIVEDEFGHYKIRAGQLNGVFLARAFPKQNSNGMRLAAEAKGSSETDAIEALKSLLTERETNRAAARRWEARSDSAVATQEEFLEALRQTSLSPAQQSMLKSLALAGEDGLVAVSIMNAGGYKSQDAAIKALAKAGGLLTVFIGANLSSDKDALDTSLSNLGYRVTAETDMPLHLILHEELREAVRQTL